MKGLIVLCKRISRIGSLNTPLPSDLQASMENSCGEDLSWFFEGWIKTKEQNNWAVCIAKSSEGSPSCFKKYRRPNLPSRNSTLQRHHISSNNLG